ncbi:MAG: aldehyde ferredoxin oxidoreductase, partial [Candidatus Heimdallarchaeota archaeon]|nr:aldehyde ferredoxin oxidoreductase [Candidatus Heimdallarchaeota archaeon]
DKLPKRVSETSLKEGAAAGRTIDIDPLLDEYYTTRKWDLKTGIPTPETLKRVGLADVVKDLPYE